jgi:glycyl-tRNA synthetase beta chain/uncharacterized protein
MDYTLIEDLLCHPKILETRYHLHHNISKHDHLLRSARLSYRLAPMLGADRRIAVRAALLHDIDSRFGTFSSHGAIAAHYAATIGENEQVCQAIISHMYPFGPLPTTREGWVLAVADKLATWTDMTQFIRGIVTGKSLPQLRQLQRSDPFYQATKKREPLWGIVKKWKQPEVRIGER